MARVSSLVDEMRVHCGHLDRLSVEQGASLRNGEIEAVLDVLRRREPVLAALASQGDQITAILEDERCIETLGTSAFAKTRRDLRSLEELADAIRMRDAEHHALMEQQRDGLAGQLASMGQKKSAMDAYSVGKGTPNPTIHDRRG